jgi:glycosyltransferase involved in cell wall biosynthesis
VRILLGADQYPEYINGAANFTARLAGGLAERGHRVDLLWPAADGRRRTGIDHGMKIHRLTSISLPGRPRMQVSTPWTASREIEAIVARSRPDVVHVQSHLPVGRTLLRIAKAFGVPVIATNHFMPENLLHHIPLVRHFPDLASRAAWRDLERVFSHADVLTAPTQRAVDLLEAWTDLPRAHAISCGIDLGTYARRSEDVPELAPTILFVGRLEQEKHIDELLRAFAMVPKNVRARLEIVGMGSLRAELETLAAALGISAAVTFFGAVSDADLVRAYRRADLFVMPGTAELQSLATLEAMAASTPIVAADAMALPHLVRHGDNGYLFRPGNVTLLAQRLNELANDADLRARFGDASLRRAQHHSLAATVSQFESHYEQLIDDQLARARVRTPRHELALTS